MFNITLDIRYDRITNNYCDLFKTIRYDFCNITVDYRDSDMSTVILNVTK